MKKTNKSSEVETGPEGGERVNRGRAPPPPTSMGSSPPPGRAASQRGFLIGRTGEP